MVERYDVVVIGGGVMGCATLHYLAELGITNTLLLERDTLASGSTGRSMTILRMHYSNHFATEMAWWSREVFEDFDNRVDCPSGFQETGWVLLPGKGNEAGALKNVEIGKAVGVETHILCVDEAKERWPFIDFKDQPFVVSEPRSGFADSHLVTSGFANSARSKGATVRLGETVSEFMRSGHTVVGIKTDQSEIFADNIVLTAGPWTNELLDRLNQPLPLKTVRHQVLRLQQQPGFGDAAESFHPIVVDIPSGLSIRPDTGGHALVGFREDEVDAHNYNRGVDSTHAIEGLEIVSSLIPAYEQSRIAGGWAGLFTVSPDWNPVVDRVPGLENVVIGAGFSGHGFKISPAIGLSLAQLTTGESAPTFDLRPTRFSRFEEGDLLKSSYGGTVFA